MEESLEEYIRHLKDSLNNNEKIIEEYFYPLSEKICFNIEENKSKYENIYQKLSGVEMNLESLRMKIEETNNINLVILGISEKIEENQEKIIKNSILNAERNILTNIESLIHYENKINKMFFSTLLFLIIILLFLELSYIHFIK